ncbi:hypothetical protein K491DRAFT_688127 [Lophiostoma macrostomum CBS 122681]|uniref:Uncharacterized protein n=1 Tax=Lophiostoma macrostomum CBS 122681 TaxID=1314788 RepID=A0A6A6TNA3_9PLEO|nr:hypothetical protein K491DRAFT_688127 [Lophiostoma macrostomum CBS 122681]
MIARTNETGCAADDKAVKIIYAGTPPMSPARRLMVDYWTWAGDVKWLQGRNLIEQISAEFAGDLVLALLEKRKKPGNRTERPWVSQPKSYRLSSQIKEESDTGVEGSAKPEATA